METRTKKITILHFITGLDAGGAEQMLLKTLPYLKNYKHIVAMVKGEENIVAKTLKEKNIKVYDLKWKGFLSFQWMKNFFEVVKKERPTILNTYLIHANIAGRILGKIARIPIIVSSFRVKKVENKFLFFLEGLTSILADRFTAVSYAVASYYHRILKIPLEKITVIQNGVDLNAFQIYDDHLKTKKELPLPLNKKTIGCIANFTPKKEHKTLILAFEKLLKEFPNTILLLVGEGPEKKKVEKLVKEKKLEKSVLFLGFQKDIPSILKILDIFVLPTSYEGLSNALLEAMAAEKAIITSRIPENEEVISENFSGLFYQSKNSEDLYQQLKKLLQDENLQKKLAQNAKKVCREKFNIKNTIRALDQFYQSLL